MPYFDYDGDININVDDFLSACDSSDIQEIIDALIADGYLPESTKSVEQKHNLSISEAEYEESLDRLHGKWNRLSTEEEQTIINISKKF